MEYILYVGEFDSMTNNGNFLTNEELNQIRSSIDIVDVISGYIPLTPKGKNYFGVCPFHDDHSPSMSVSKDKQIYTCWSCGATGNVFKFVMDYENISFIDAVKIIADKAGISVSLNNARPVKQEKNQDVYDIYELSQKLYQNNINTSLGLKAKEYLKERDIGPEIIKEFGIGLALKEKELLTNFLIKKKYPIGTILKTGLVNKNSQGYYDMYYNRIMFPLWNLNGQVVGFSGRIYDTNDSSKYINSKESEIFKKGELLYNYHRAKDTARQAGSIIIMEGFMDVIRAYSVGIKNTIATMGTAVTKQQATLIKRMAKEVILCFDGDEAGAKATLSCSNELIAIGVTPKVVRLEKNMDPDEYIREYGKERFLHKIENPISIMDFKLNYLKENKDLNNNDDYSKYIHQVINELTKVDDPILIELTLSKLSHESNVSIEILRNELENIRTIDDKVATTAPIKKNVEKVTKYEIAEKNLLFYMINYRDVVKIYNKKAIYMPTEKYRRLARKVCDFYKKNDNAEVADLYTEVSIEESNLNALHEIMSLNLKENYSVEEIQDYINTIYEYNVKFESKRIQEQMKKEADPTSKAILAQKLVELRLLKDKEMER